MLVSRHPGLTPIGIHLSDLGSQQNLLGPKGRDFFSEGRNAVRHGVSEVGCAEAW
jgi:hypothetical protein